MDIARLKKDGRVLIHAATGGVGQAAVIWQRAILPKVAGTMNLHKCLHDLSFFIMLSSISGVVGNVSQANYTAGNTFQDALARHRTANCLPGVAIDLGYVAKGDESLRGRVERNFGSNVVMIEAAIRNPQRQNPDESQVVTCIANDDAFAEGTLVKKDRRFRTLRLGSLRTVTAKIVTGDGSGGVDELVKALSKSTGAEAAKLANATLVSKLSTLFNVPTSEIDTGLPLSHYGVDSLVAVELRNWLSSAIKAKVTIFEILQGVAMSNFTALVAKRSGLLIAPKV